MREIGRFKADLPKNMWHLTQQIQRLSVGLLQVNPQTVQRHNSVVGDFASATDSILVVSHTASEVDA